MKKKPTPNTDNSAVPPSTQTHCMRDASSTSHPRSQAASPDPQSRKPAKRWTEPALNGLVVCIGLDVHENQVTAVRQIDGSLPQPAQRFERDKLVAWIKVMISQGAVVHSCYEAGCFGYALHRDLLAAGAQNRVIAPENWCGNQKTDARDAREMCLRLERFVRGNPRALCVILVPSVEQEKFREKGRNRERLLKERQRLAARGSGLIRKAGLKVPKNWWLPTNWPAFMETLPSDLAEDLSVWQAQIITLDQSQGVVRAALEQQGLQGPEQLPKGLGGLTWRLLSGEILSWTRFKNRREVGSFTGLCPGENSSGEKQKQGGINRHGSPRVRTLLIEATWRLTRYEHGWRGFAKFPILLEKGCAKSKSTRGRRKAVAAAARLLAVDLWRLATDQTTGRALGFSVDWKPESGSLKAPVAAAGSRGNEGRRL